MAKPAKGYTQFTEGNFTVRLWPDTVQISRWCLPDGEAGSLDDFIELPRGVYDAIVQRIDERKYGLHLTAATRRSR